MPAHHGHGSSAGRSSRPVGGSFRLPPREPETGRRPGMVQHARSKKRACITPSGSRRDTPSHSVSYCVQLYHVYVLRPPVLASGCFTAVVARAVCCATNQFSTDLQLQHTDRPRSRSSRRHGWRGRGRRLSPRCPALLPGHEKSPRIVRGLDRSGPRGVAPTIDERTRGAGEGAVRGIAAPIAEIPGRPSASYVAVAYETVYHVCDIMPRAGKSPDQESGAALCSYSEPSMRRQGSSLSRTPRLRTASMA